ncbi:restriction endonuclease subunit S [Lactobacillus delbrueckii subsp. bulgaricus]|uniref:restriction endonuclease subunit S n=1 Tax=Lactobacillus delbrueckii TaxID=1584 RepID=UPI001E436C2A|nr:restriction endonuclease subunit S [Lactobacillus delbrueckii]MCD5481366.1 restriction endonuclease subunit S [Lactobacillus delbrueckii subsp. bulgaricus]
MKDEKKAPKLRFKGFTDDWEQCKLGDVCEEVSGNNGNVKGLPILTISAANGWMNQKDRFSQVIAGNELKKYTLLKKGHLAYNHGNSKQAKYGTVFVQNLYDQALVPRVYHSFKMKTENNPYYVEYYFATKKLDRELARLVTSGARMDGLLNINKKDFFKIKFEVPTPVEQSLIGTILQKLDQTITLHEEKKHQLERLKSALLQKMFADKSGYPDIRFEGFSDEWEQCKLGDVAKINSGKDYKGLQPGKIPVYGTGGYMLSVNDKLSDIDAIGIGRKGTIDKPYYLNAPFWTVDTLFYVTPRGTVDISFMFPLFKNINWKRYDESTGVPSLSKNTIKKIRVSFPQNNEQVKIGDLFQKITQIITLHDQKLNLLKLVKQSLLQKMFI